MRKLVCLRGMFLFGLLLVTGCSAPKSGPDKTVAGAVLGGAWGAGAGAVIGNQIDASGEGAAVGAAFGAADGAMAGIAYDSLEPELIRQQEQLKAIEVQNMTNQRELASLTYNFDRAGQGSTAGGVYQVFFDADATSLRPGAVANLEVIAEEIKRNPAARKIHVVGHTDDNGNPEYNQRLAEARARTVAGYIASRGISYDQILVSNHGAQRPIATNASETGRQLNRRVDVYIAP